MENVNKFRFDAIMFLAVNILTVGFVTRVSLAHILIAVFIIALAVGGHKYESEKEKEEKEGEGTCNT